MTGTNDMPLAALLGSAPASSPHQSAAVNRRDFFDAVVERVRTTVSAERRMFRHRANPMLLKIDFGNDRVHYEVWPDSARKHVEVGLHFEDGPASTAAYLAFFDARIVEIKHDLGVRMELERWTSSWGHLYETLPLTRLDRTFARIVGDRLAAQIDILQPMVEEAGILPEPRVSTVKRSRWSRAAR